MTSTFSWQNSVSLCPASFHTPRPNLPVTPGVSLEKAMQPTLVVLPGKSHGWGSLVGYSPGGCKELDTTERVHFHFHSREKEMATHSCPCLENPRDGEPGVLPSMGSHRFGHDYCDLAARYFLTSYFCI